MFVGERIKVLDLADPAESTHAAVARLLGELRGGIGGCWCSTSREPDGHGIGAARRERNTWSLPFATRSGATSPHR
jgi:hypothetical protein